MAESFASGLLDYVKRCDFATGDEEREEALRMGTLCKHVYVGGDPPAGWNVLEHSLVGFVREDASIGFCCQLYEGSGTYVLAFAGVHSEKGISESFLQLMGASRAYEVAVANAQLVVKEFGTTKMVFTGHSLGGGMANAAALSTGCRSITFNPAWLTTLTKKKIAQQPSARITNYVMFAEPLDVVQRFSSVLGKSMIAVLPVLAFLGDLEATGKYKYVQLAEADENRPYIDRHRMEVVYNGLCSGKAAEPLGTLFVEQLAALIEKELQQIVLNNMMHLMAFTEMFAGVTPGAAKSG
ncbi:phospholipase A1 [Trypanosoma vivax]|uniref:Phospholipase A1 n=1 Tax=Trypanosoma vivax (strain Y486) TaxID=1055687 RepID=G0TRK4_TRYVY|nr:phospholipase A1 [Trypanosoma vivax]KAH8604018.1 phospholipase A1 [Trypanosoma vivax]CCC46570.1 phospholipase A1 [Trypanosoma vivax Y486]